jgi:ADP-heptose:LPS heptosyltransferase
VGGPRWVRYRSVAYLRGRGFGFGVDNIFPREAYAVGKYFINADALKAPNTTIIDKDLSVLAERSFDYGMLGPNWLKHPTPQQFLQDAARKLKVGGHLLVLVPVSGLTSADLMQMVAKVAPWTLKATYTRDNYHLQIYKLTTGKAGIHPSKSRPATKRACIARYGAIGDLVMVTPLIERLAKDGYAVTLNITEYAAPVIENNPHISNIIYQEKDAIPNPELKAYWDEWAGDYDKYINLSESVEGRLLRVEGRPDFYTPKSLRHSECNTNYIEHTLAIGGYTDGPYQPTLYLTTREKAWAQRFKDQHGKRLVVWALAGSSHHKTYSFLQNAIAGFVDAHPDAIVVTVGSEANAALEFEYPNVIRQAGKLTLRQTMALVSVADMVVGPESAVINFASAFDVPKVVMLSHSTHENLCKHWTNDYCITPTASLAPCYPCHQLHYSLESCPVTQIVDNETSEVIAEGPACSTSGIPVEDLLARLNQAYYRV